MSLGIPEVGAFGLDRLEDSIAKWEAGNKNNRGGGGAASSLLQSQQGPGEGESIGTRHQAPPPLDPGAPRRMVHIDSQGRPSVVSVCSTAPFGVRVDWLTDTQPQDILFDVLFLGDAVFL